jgi:hypothetical protein
VNIIIDDEVNVHRKNSGSVTRQRNTLWKREKSAHAAAAFYP